MKNFNANFFTIGVVFTVVFSEFAFSTTSDESSLVLVNANYNENTMSGAELISLLQGDVIFEYGDITVRAEQAKWWRNQKTVRLWDNVKVEKKQQSFSCISMDFDGAAKTLSANGRLRLEDLEQRVVICGEQGLYDIDKRFFTLTGSPYFMHFDTAAAETLRISGLKMTYNDSTKIATVTDSVRIIKGELTCLCNSAIYYVDSNKTLLRKTPHITFKKHSLKGDSIDLAFKGRMLKSANVMGNTHGVYIDYTKTDTTTTNIWGDSSFIVLSDSGYIDSIWVYGNVISKYFESSATELVNQVSGKVMLVAFKENEGTDELKVWGNVKSVYYINEKDGKGRNEASGDSLYVILKGGRASFLALSGGTRGIYFPQNE